MKKAFTVLELIFVIVILGILSSIALPKFYSSKDEAEISKTLHNLKTLINDLNLYALKYDKLDSIGEMTQVHGIENIDLNSNFSQKQAYFKVGNDTQCLNLIFINKKDFVLFGISSNEQSKIAIENAANGSKNTLENIDFTSQSENKTCIALSKNEYFKNLANKTYILLGQRHDN